MAPVHPAAFTFYSSLQPHSGHRESRFPSPAIPGEMHVSCCFPYLHRPQRLSRPTAARAWGRGCRDFLPEPAGFACVSSSSLLGGFSKAGGCCPRLGSHIWQEHSRGFAGQGVVCPGLPNLANVHGDGGFGSGWIHPQPCPAAHPPPPPAPTHLFLHKTPPSQCLLIFFFLCPSYEKD